MSERIGEYEILERLGGGGFGDVYRANDPHIEGHQVAIKILKTSEDPDTLRRFRREAAIISKLKHKSIVTVHSTGESNGRPYIVMELLEGADLRQVIDNQASEPVSILDKVRIMSQVAEGLQHAHDNGVVHRDIKPENIRVLPTGRVVLLDFGIAGIAQKGTDQRTQIDKLAKTWDYSTPEHFRAAGSVDEVSDVFAFGIVYYELLTGTNPFRGESPMATMWAILNNEPPPIRQFVADCPEGLERIVERALAKERDIRYQSMQEILLDTELILVDLRQQRAAELFAEVKTLLESSSPEVMSVLRQVLDLDTTHPEARRLYADLQRAARDQAARNRLETLLREGDGLMQQRKFSDAAQVFENASKVDRNHAEAKARLEDARKAQEGARRAARLLLSVRREEQANNLESAAKLLEEALAADAGNPEVLAARDGLQLRFAESQRDRRRQEVLAQAEALTARLEFRAAESLLDTIEAEQPGHAEIPVARDAIRRAERAESDRRERERAEALGLANSLRAAGQYPQVQARLSALAAIYPNDPEVQALQAEVDRDLYVQAAATEARALLGQERYGEAVRQVENGLAAAPGDAVLEELLARGRAGLERLQLQEEVAATLARIHQFHAAGDWEEAIASAEEAARDFPSEVRFERLAKQFRTELDLQQVLRSATPLVQSNPPEAIDLLQQARKRLGRQTSIDTLLAAARERLPGWQREIDRARTLKELIALERDGDVAAVLGRARLAAAEYPESGEIGALLRRVRQRDLATRLRGAIEAGDWDLALGLGQETESEFSGDAELAGLTAQARNSKRQAEWQALHQNFRRALERSDLDGAARLLGESAESLEESSQWHELQRELLRLRQAEDAVRQAESLRSEWKFGQAEALLVGVTSQVPEHASARELLAKVREQRQRNVEEHLGEADRLVNAGSVAAALAFLEEVCGRYPDEAALGRARAGVAELVEEERQAKERAKREEERREAERLAAERLAAEAEDRKRREAEEEQRRAEEERLRAEAEARRKAEEEARRREEEERRRAEEEARRKRELEARQRAAEEARKKAEADESRRQEEEARRRAEEERKKAEEERRRVEEEKRKAAEVARREEAERRKAEKKLAQERKRKAEAEAAAEREQARKEAEVRRNLDLEARRRELERQSRATPPPTGGAGAVAPEAIPAPVSPIQVEPLQLTPPATPFHKQPAILAVGAIGLIATAALIVWLSVGPKPTPIELSPNPSLLEFQASSEPGARSPKAQALRFGVGDVPFELSANQQWIKVTPAKGNSLGQGVEVSVDSGSLKPGRYEGVIRLTSPESSRLTGSREVKVTLQVAAKQKPVVSLPGGALRFTHQAEIVDSGRRPAAKRIGISPAGAEAVCSAAADVPWISVTRVNGGFSVAVDYARQNRVGTAQGTIVIRQGADVIGRYPVEFTVLPPK